MSGIDLHKETVLSLSEAAARLPGRGAKRCSVSTVWRWCLRGCRAKDGSHVFLEHVRVGNTRFTTVEALQRFFFRLTEADRQVQSPESRYSRAGADFSPERQRAIRTAQEKLRAAGF